MSFIYLVLKTMNQLNPVFEQEHNKVLLYLHNRRFKLSLKVPQQCKRQDPVNCAVLASLLKAQKVSIQTRF